MTSKQHSIAEDRKTVRYYLNIVAEEDAHAEAIAALERIVEQLEALEAASRKFLSHYYERHSDPWLEEDADALLAILGSVSSPASELKP